MDDDDSFISDLVSCDRCRASLMKKALRGTPNDQIVEADERQVIFYWRMLLLIAASAGSWMLGYLSGKFWLK